MTKPYPMELRLRAVRFVEAGESRHAVAARLGVSVSTVVKWLQRFSMMGTVAPGKVGGHRKPKIAGPHRDWVLAQVQAGDVTLHGLADGLSARGLKVDAVTVWNFLRREGKRFQKIPCLALNRTAGTSPGRAIGGRSIRTGSILRGWCSSTRHGPRPTWLRFMTGARRAGG